MGGSVPFPVPPLPAAAAVINNGVVPAPWKAVAASLVASLFSRELRLERDLGLNVVVLLGFMASDFPGQVEGQPFKGRWYDKPYSRGH